MNTEKKSLFIGWWARENLNQTGAAVATGSERQSTTALSENDQHHRMMFSAFKKSIVSVSLLVMLQLLLKFPTV
jgi:hypothetical protein